MLKVFCDGGCSGNPGKGAWAYVAFYKEKIIYSDSGVVLYTTNNQMELLASIKALQMFDCCEVIVDSKYVIDGINIWIKSWKNNNWKGSSGAVKNLELWQELDTLNQNRKITWKWQRGHANSLHDYVDLLARRSIKF